MPKAPDSQAKFALLSPIHAAMQVIRDFTDPGVMACGPIHEAKRGKSREVSKKERWLYDRILAVHRLSLAAIERDEKDSKG